MKSHEPDPRLAALYAEPPERFVAARDALARELDRAGDPSAASVRALRRPTRRLWILNRLSRDRPREVAEALEAGARLKRSHAAALRGEKSDLRAADQEMSRCLDALVASARRALADAGHPADHALLVGTRSDLRTIATRGGRDAERLRTGTLDHLPRSGVEDALGGAPVPPRARGARSDVDDRSAQRRRVDEARVRRDAARASSVAANELRRAERAFAAAERAFNERERAAAKAEAAAETARRRAGDAANERDHARERLAKAQQAARALRR